MIKINRDLTVGNPGKVLISFTLPLFASVVFQQLYSIADSVIAGKYAGESALAAVGASYPITMIFMAIAFGCQIGCSVVISRFFGAGKHREVKTCITTSLIAGLVLSAVLTLFGVLGSPRLMKLVNTPDDIMNEGNLYLKIYTGGFIFLFIYNVVTGIFNSLGDSRTPLVFLIISSLGNIVLDAVFVIVFKWGVAGVAWATFIAQGASCLLSLAVLTARMKHIAEGEKPPVFSKSALKDIVSVAVPSVLQQSFVSVGNMFIQSMVNSFGSSVIAGYSAAIKLNTFAVTSFSTFGNGISSLTAQNNGAGKLDRVKQGFKSGIIFTLCAAGIFTAVFLIFGRQLLGLFMNDDSTELALETGMDFMKTVAPFYFTVATKLLCDGVLRGSESMKHFMAATFTDLIMRVVLAYILSRFMGALGIWNAWPVSWATAAVMSFVFYAKGVWIKQNQKPDIKV